MEKVIKKAIEGGYKCGAYNITLVEKRWYEPKEVCFHIDMDRTGETVVTKTVKISEILLDPLFWQALGKAEGWHYCKFHSFASGQNDDVETCQDCSHDEWTKHWHSFIDHLAEGKLIDTFFDDILK